MCTHRPRRLSVLGFVLIGTLFSIVPKAFAGGLTTKSPEVLAAVEKGAKFLASAAAKDDRIGAQALMGLAIVMESGKADHPRVLQCADNIRKALGDRKEGAGGAVRSLGGPDLQRRPGDRVPLGTRRLQE